MKELWMISWFTNQKYNFSKVQTRAVPVELILINLQVATEDFIIYSIIVGVPNPYSRVH